MAKIIITWHSQQASRSLEKKVNAIIAMLKYSESLDGAKNAFNYELNRTSTGNNTKAHNHYRMVQIGEFKIERLEIYAEKAAGDLGRHVATITEEKEVRNG